MHQNSWRSSRTAGHPWTAGQPDSWTDMDRISLAFLLCLAMGKPSWGMVLLLLLHLKRPKLLQKHVTLSAQTAATGSLWDLSAFIAAGILRAFALKLTLACGFPLCLFPPSF